MKLFFILIFLFSSRLQAQPSRYMPQLLEATEIYLSLNSSPPLIYQQEIRELVDAFVARKIDRRFLARIISEKNVPWSLPARDVYDEWMKRDIIEESTFSITLHLPKIKVVEDSDDVSNDDLYLYFFITDGTIPTGKVTSIYRGLDEGTSFLLSETDRQLFPLSHLSPRTVQSHIIIDYGIVESDGDDVKELQKLSSLIIDLAAIFYERSEPGYPDLDLRREVKNMASFLLNLNDDDRLVTSSFGLTAAEIQNLLPANGVHEFRRKHKKKTFFDDWEYHLSFRLLKGAR